MLLLIRQAVLSTALLALLLCAVYPLLLTGVGALVFPHQVQGSLVREGDRIVGSALVGQNFSGPEYFHARPSAAGDKGYDGQASGGSNLGPSSKLLAARMSAEAQALRTEIGSAKSAEAQAFLAQTGLAKTGLAQLPVDLLTASGSGLDPHISPAGALLQVARVARARQLPVEKVQALVHQATQGPEWGLWGEARVNVLLLNKALNGLGG